MCGVVLCANGCVVEITGGSYPATSTQTYVDKLFVLLCANMIGLMLALASHASTG